MTLWIFAWILTIVFFSLAILVWLRKIIYDKIHHNFLDLEDEFGGQVIRKGFAVRPQYLGLYKGMEFLVSISSEKNKKQRRYYIAISMKAKAKRNFSIMSKDWLGEKANNKRNMLPIKDQQYLVEAADTASLKKLNTHKLETVVTAMDPFAYILVGGKKMLLERISTNIAEDTKLEYMRPLLEGMYLIKTI